MSIKIEGLDQTLRNMRELAAMMGPRSRSSPLLPAIRAAGKVVQAAAKQKVRKKSGALHDNIIVARVRKDRLKGATEAVEVTVRYKAKAYKDNNANRRKGRVGGTYEASPLFYGRFLEFGTSKMPAYPFMRPAFDANSGALPGIIQRELAKSIEAQIAKMRKR